MKSLIETIKNIYFNDRRILVWVAILLVCSGLLILVTILNLSPEAEDGVIIRYGDSGGYEKGNWWYMIGFAMMGLVTGVLHPLFSVRIYEKRGASVAIMFLAISIMMVSLLSLVLMRLLGEQ